eukprot:PRCOL_00002089-RA
MGGWRRDDAGFSFAPVCVPTGRAGSVDGAPNGSAAARSATVASERLLALVRGASAQGRPPISRFNVGAVGVASSGRLYCGCNLEFCGSTMNATIHAEQFLCVVLAIHGERGMDELAVTAPPCGHCRQFMQELPAAGDVAVHIHRLSKVDKTDDAAALVRHDREEERLATSLHELLPHAFGPSDLVPDPTYLLQHSDECTRQALIDARDGILAAYVSGGAGDAHGKLSEGLAKAARLARSNAYTPYSNCKAGVALVGADGRYAWGYNVECAAFNPTIAPLQFALVHWVQGGGGDWMDIQRVTLCEEVGNTSYEAATRALLCAIAPEAHLEVVRP